MKYVNFVVHVNVHVHVESGGKLVKLVVLLKVWFFGKEYWDVVDFNPEKNSEYPLKIEYSGKDQRC